MDEISTPDLGSSERAELDAVLAALVRKPRLAALLRYLAEKRFQGKTDEINEYNIAIEVFGRSTKSFDASRDSITRVEAYRLRRLLKEYYETEGRDHEVEISLPLGSYIPAFADRSVSPAEHAADGAGSAVSSSEIAQPVQAAFEANTPERIDLESTHSKRRENGSPLKLREPKTGEPGPIGGRKRLFRYGVAATAAVILLVFISMGYSYSKRNAPGARRAEANQAAGNQQPSDPAAQAPIRLLAGYQGNPRIDSSGAYWEADRYFTGGAAQTRPNAPIAKTSDPMLFEHWRATYFDYNIPLSGGPYELHLFFVASQSESDPSDSFEVHINDQPLLQYFNVEADALGANVADERVFKDIYPSRDGYLHLQFRGGKATALVNAIEILPGLPHRQLPIRLVTQRRMLTDHNGNHWSADNYYKGGILSDLLEQVGGTSDPSLYAQERFGHFTYSIPVDTRGRYTVTLHFAELYWGPQIAGFAGAGSRLFNVFCNGTTLLDNFDIYKEAGSLHAVTKTFRHLRPTAEGKLEFTFDPIVNNASISAIEVVDESE